MKKIFLLSVYALIIGYAFGQSKPTVEYDKSEICQLTVNDEHMYQLLDTFCEWEKLQPYYMDTNFSIQLKIFFESDSNYAEFGNVFIAMIRFKKTLPLVAKWPEGFFPYKSTNVFVSLLQSHLSPFSDSLPVDTNSQLADYPMVNRIFEFPKRFTMLSKNESPPQVFYYPWYMLYEEDVVRPEEYKFRQIWFTHDKNGFHFYGYSTPE